MVIQMFVVGWSIEVPIRGVAGGDSGLVGLCLKIAPPDAPL